MWLCLKHGIPFWKIWDVYSWIRYLKHGENHEYLFFIRLFGTNVLASSCFQKYLWIKEIFLNFEFSLIKNCQLWICVIILFYIKDLYRVIICNKTKKKKHWKKSMDSPLITFFQKSYFWENIFTLGWYFKSIGTIIALKFIKIVFWEFPHELKLLH